MTFRRDAMHPYLTLKQWREAFEAEVFARHLACPLNLTFTIHWSVAGGTGDHRDRRRVFLDSLWRFLSYHGAARHARIWTAEIDPQGKDAHLHGAVHVPLSLDYRAVEAYMRRLLGNPPEKEALKVDLPTAHCFGIRGWLKYMCKALPPDLKHLLPSHRKFHVRQGAIYGPRIGISRHIGPTARERAGVRYSWIGDDLVPPPALTESSEINERIEARHRRRYGT
jgi:hypothetical protein